MESVVAISNPIAHVVTVEMCDRPNSNQLTAALVSSLMTEFARIGADPDVHAVIIHGFDSIFCTGGTQAELLSIVDGGLHFDAIPFYRLLLDCEVPVIAAMQGHALGGGLVFGMYADIVLLAEEAVYSANFMKYGFTPGMGATSILPAKLGSALASEMMLTAQSYRGSQLRDRGVPFVVHKRAEVLPAALRIARELASKPRLSLQMLKRNLTARLAADLSAAVKLEIDMHMVTFAQPGVRERIEQQFGE
jgi:polyketide biosynthesis enoyl-CoA hydratase PksI